MVFVAQQVCIEQKDVFEFRFESCDGGVQGYGSVEYGCIMCFWALWKRFFLLLNATHRLGHVEAWVVRFIRQTGLLELGFDMWNMHVVPDKTGKHGKGPVAGNLGLTHFMDNDMDCLWSMLHDETNANETMQVHGCANVVKYPGCCGCMDIAVELAHSKVRSQNIGRLLTFPLHSRWCSSSQPCAPLAALPTGPRPQRRNFSIWTLGESLPDTWSYRISRSSGAAFQGLGHHKCHLRVTPLLSMMISWHWKGTGQSQERLHPHQDQRWSKLVMARR